MDTIEIKCPCCDITHTISMDDCTRNDEAGQDWQAEVGCGQSVELSQDQMYFLGLPR